MLRLDGAEHSLKIGDRMIYIYLLMALGLIVLDQVSKQLIAAYLSLGESIELIPGVFRFTYVQNRGAAFGMLSDNRWVFLILSTLAIAAILVYMLLMKPQSRLCNISLSLILAGGIGNMIDRVAFGYVIDFIDFCAFPKLWMWIFNVADICVCVGVGLMVLYLILDLVSELKGKKAAEEKPE